MSSTEAPLSESAAQGLLFDGDFSAAPGGPRVPRTDRVQRGGHHLPPVGLLGPHRAGRAGDPVGHGSGTQRLYSFRDILILKVIKRLLDAGISLQQIRAAIDHLRARGVEDLTEVTLMSDGVSVFECTSDDEVIDLLRGGQGVFGIALGGVWRDIEGTLAKLPAEAVAATAEGDPQRRRVVDAPENPRGRVAAGQSRKDGRGGIH